MNPRTPWSETSPAALSLEMKNFRLFIDGKHYLSRGLDLACNPFNGNVLGEVVLVLESLLQQKLDEEEETVRLFHNKA